MHLKENWWKRAKRSERWTFSNHQSADAQVSERVRNPSACLCVRDKSRYRVEIIVPVVCDWSKFASCDSCIDNKNNIRIASWLMHTNEYLTCSAQCRSHLFHDDCLEWVSATVSTISNWSNDCSFIHAFIS